MTAKNAIEQTGNEEASVTQDAPQTPPNDDFFEMVLPEVTEQKDDYIEDDAPQSEDEEVRPEGDDNREDIPENDDKHAAEKVRGTLDKKGAAFDPALHKFPPEQTPAGKWRRIPKSEREKMTSAPDDEKVESNASNRLEAQKMVQLYATLHAPLWGVENVTPSQPHYLSLVDAVETYFNENGSIELPSSLSLILSAGSYTSEIATRKSNMERSKALLKKMINPFKKLFAKKDKSKEAEKAKKEADERNVKKENDIA